MHGDNCSVGDACQVGRWYSEIAPICLQDTPRCQHETPGQQSRTSDDVRCVLLKPWACAQTGRRITEVAVLAGSVVRIWGALERILSRHEHQLSRSDRTMRVLRVDLGSGNSLVGG